MEWANQPFAFNKTESRFGVRGPISAYRFEHKNRVLLFVWRYVAGGRDKQFSLRLGRNRFLYRHHGAERIVAYVSTKQPPVVQGISQGGFEVPLDGFSYQGLNVRILLDRSQPEWVMLR
jgi:hypothetical protein